MKTVAIIQARMASTRLPGKVLLPLAGRPMLERVIERARACRTLDSLVVATSDAPADDAIAAAARACGAEVFRGSHDDVLDRYHRAARQFAADIVVRLTADCPLLDPDEVDRLVREFRAGDLDWMATGLTHPEGYGAEVFRRAALERAWAEARLPSEREHATAYLWTHPELFKTARMELPEDFSHFRLTVDEPCDVRVVSAVLEAFPGARPGLAAVVEFLREHPEIASWNAGIGRFAGYRKSVATEQAAAS